MEEEARIFLWTTYAGSARLEPGTHAWLAKQSDVLSKRHGPFPPTLQADSAKPYSAGIDIWRLKSIPVQ